MTPHDGQDTSRVSLEEWRALVALSMVGGVGPARIRALLARFGSAAAAMGASRQALAQVKGVGPQTASTIAAFDNYDAVEEQLRRAEKADAVLVPSWGAQYPPLLKQIYDPPVFLWMRGALTGADARALAIVGTRRCTDYGRQQAERFAAELVREGFTIVSGLAYGIDAAAHRGALEAGGRSVAVLGSGVDRIYPARHTRLARQMIGRGAVLSEYALGAAPDASNFPRRNRVISGMTLGTLVVEAHETGGALITARLALEQNREVFAIPSSVRSKAGVGTNRLIQRGHAKLVLTVDDVLEELNLLAAQLTARADKDGEDDASLEVKNLSKLEKRLFEVLGTEPVHIDALCAETGLDPSSALVYLLNLEFKGLIRQMAGKQFYRA